MKFDVKDGRNGHATVDWAATKREILSKLDLAAEYRALGVEFATSSPNGKGILECHAMGRRDDVPSAMVNVRTGIYHDSGGSGESLNFWDFALKHGPSFGRHVEVVRHYGEKVGVDVPTPHYHSGGRIREAQYLYRDERGEVRYAVFRYRLPNGKKTFTQHPPDGRGGWKFGTGAMDGVEPLPYRLPELLVADPSDPVFVVEGEKDADRLAAEGLTATTNHQGAQSTDKTWPKFREHFRGRTCIILPDNDQGGLKHAIKVAAYLHGLAASVKLLELPGLPPKGDVSDWLDAGGTIEELGRLAHAAPEWDPAAEGLFDVGEKPEAATDDELLPPDEDVISVRLSDVKSVPIEWLMPGRIPIGKLTLLAGLAKQGKSFLTMDLAARVSTGAEIPCGDGESMARGSVILLSAEDDLDDTIKPRLEAAGADSSRIEALTTIKLPDGTFGPFNLSYIPHLERLIVRQRDTKLVIIDPITHYIGSRVDDHKVAQLRALLGPLKELASRRRVAILVVTHFNKGSGTNALNRVIGSSAYTALARANWILMRDPKDPKRRLFLDAGTNLAEDPDGLAFRIVDGRIAWEDEVVSQNANDMLQQEQDEQKDQRKEAGGGKVEAARDWLANLLASMSEIPSEEILRQGQAKGFGRDTLFEAKKNLGIKARKSREHRGAWVWFREASDTADASDTSTVRHFDGSNGTNGVVAEDLVPF